MVDDVRRRRCAPVVVWVEEGDARLINSPREAKLVSSLERKGTWRIDYVGRVTPRGRVAGKKWCQDQKESGETKDNVGQVSR